jgi:lycopene cyclase-like protein
VRDDVLIVGNGPAGLGAATCCAEHGLRVTVLAPDHRAEWPNTYGIWEDELGAFAEHGVLASRWPQVTVRLGGPALHLARAYGRIDNARLRTRLLERCAAAGGRLLSGRARAVEVEPAGPVVHTVEGARLPCRVVVDASGHRPALLAPGAGGRPAFQAAYGLLAETSAAPIEPGSMVLMDYRDAPLRGLPGVREDPTFLYAMDLGDGRWFVEETSLARRPGLGSDVLQARLHRRLRAAGVTITRRLQVEHCRFPMGTPLPPRNQIVVGFGSAAGMVHPATGYQVGTALRRAPLLATALRDALDAPAATPASVAAEGWAAVWPPDLVRQRALHAFGLETLLRLDTAQTQAFFSTFFSLPARDWQGYLSGARSAASVARTMLALFGRAPGSLRAALMTAALGRPLRVLLRALP